MDVWDELDEAITGVLASTPLPEPVSPECQWAHAPDVWWCAKVVTEPDGTCRPCAVVEKWNATGADPDQTPSFLLPDSEL